MQFMYLRKFGKNKNPGRHPIGLIGVEKIDGAVSVAVQLIHSSDRFSKEVGRTLLQQKIFKDRRALIVDGDAFVSLHEILPKSVINQLDSYNSHQEILDKLIKDEMTGGSWSTQAKKNAAVQA